MRSFYLFIPTTQACTKTQLPVKVDVKEEEYVVKFCIKIVCLNRLLSRLSTRNKSSKAKDGAKLLLFFELAKENLQKNHFAILELTRRPFHEPFSPFLAWFLQLNNVLKHNSE